MSGQVLKGSAQTLTIKTARGTGVTKGALCNSKGAGSCYRALGSGCTYRPSVPLLGALLNRLFVTHSPCFNCIGPLGASKNIGLAQT